MCSPFGKDIRLSLIHFTSMSFPPSSDYEPTLTRVRKFFRRPRKRFVCLLIGAISISGFAAFALHSNLRDGIDGLFQGSGSTYRGSNRWGYHDNEGSSLVFLVFLSVASIYLWGRVFAVGRSLYRTRWVVCRRSIDKSEEAEQAVHGNTH